MKKVNKFAHTSKSDGSFRIILNLKSWMIICHIYTLKWKPLNLNLVVPNSDMAKIDIKMHCIMFYPDFPEHQKFLKFSLQGKPYKFTCLHNRLCSGPRKFTKLLKTRISWTKVRQYKNCSIYWWFNKLAYSFDICFKNVWKCVKRLGNLAFVVIQKNHFLFHLRKLNTCGL